MRARPEREHMGPQRKLRQGCIFPANSLHFMLKVGLGCMKRRGEEKRVAGNAEGNEDEL